MHNKPHVLVCALKEEQRAILAGLGNAADRFEIIQAGVGPRSAAHVGTQLAARKDPPNLVISSGFCGGLHDDLKLGDLVLASKIFTSRDTLGAASFHAIEFDRAKKIIETQIAAALQKNSVRFKLGSVVCTPDAVAQSESKRALGIDSGAIAVDMESFALAEKLDASRTSFFALRAISDTIDDELPAEVGEFLDQSGRVRLGKIARFVMRKPTRVKFLMDLSTRATAAAKSLTAAWSALRNLEFKL